jgi:hypothetical protein
VPKAQLQQESDASFRDRVRLVKTKARKILAAKKQKNHKNAKTPKKERKGRRKS